MSTAKFLLRRLLKQPRRAKGARGFTLIELLITMIVTFLIITPLLGLVTSFMTSDRQEQAKSSSQQEIQAALDYMAQDMQQAVYIYDATGLSATDGILNQIPPAGGAVAGCEAGECFPVLAFWKRKYLDKNDVINGLRIGDINDSSIRSDRFVYSLVVYYLIKDAPTNNSVWSPVARIGRFEIRDGIPDPTVDNPDPDNNADYLLPPSAGFSPIPAISRSDTLRQTMNAWTKANATYNQPVDILVDYIDDTPVLDFPTVDNIRNRLTPPPNNATDTDGFLAANGCATRFGIEEASRVPADNSSLAATTGSFYACVRPVNELGQSVARVFIRGNALARLSNNPQSWAINGGNQVTQLNNRPIANVLVSVRGLIGAGEE
jgi:type II secretory pathway pseudopilin PulG